jgi:hypothetical protein
MLNLRTCSSARSIGVTTLYQTLVQMEQPSHLASRLWCVRDMLRHHPMLLAWPLHPTTTPSSRGKIIGSA